MYTHISEGYEKIYKIIIILKITIKMHSVKQKVSLIYS